MDRQARRIEFVIGEVATQLLAHEFEKSRKPIAWQCAIRADAQRSGARADERSRIDQAGIEKLFQNEIAARQRTIRRASGIVVARPLDQSDQQRDVGRIERLDLATEIEFRSGGESMYSLATLLGDPVADAAMFKQISAVQNAATTSR